MRLPSVLRRVPAGFVGMLVMVVCVDSFVARHRLNLRNSWGWDWSLADQAARGGVGDCEVLFFGDSLVKLGVSPQVFERSGGGKAYNLAVIGGQVPGSYFLLRRAIEAGSRPRAVVLDTIPHLIAEGLDSTASAGWPELLSYRDGVELSLEARDPHFFASMMLAKAFPSVRHRFEIRNSVAASLRGEPQPIGDALLAYLRNWGVNRGAQIMKRDPASASAQIAGMASAMFPDSWRPDPAKLRYLHEFFDLADAHGIRAYWLLPPFTPEVQKRRESNGRDAEYSAFVKSVQARHPNLVVLDARRSGYGEGELYDPIHLDVRGASTLSHDLAAILRRGPAGVGRWEALPAFRELRSQVPLEDVGQSAAAVTSTIRR